jgi:hemoglobin
METPFDAAGGIDGMGRLAHAWHQRVLADEVVAHAFSHGVHPRHTERLAAYWAEALGGPDAYSSTCRDESSVVRAHSGNGAHHDMDERVVACFDEAMVDVGIDASPALLHVLHDYFAWVTASPMARYPESADDVPPNLVLTRWSWEGRIV